MSFYEIVNPKIHCISRIKIVKLPDSRLFLPHTFFFRPISPQLDTLACKMKKPQITCGFSSRMIDHHILIRNIPDPIQHKAGPVGKLLYGLPCGDAGEDQNSVQTSLDSRNDVGIHAVTDHHGLRGMDPKAL